MTSCLSLSSATSSATDPGRGFESSERRLIARLRLLETSEQAGQPGWIGVADGYHFEIVSVGRPDMKTGMFGCKIGCS